MLNTVLYMTVVTITLDLPKAHSNVYQKYKGIYSDTIYVIDIPDYNIKI